MIWGIIGLIGTIWLYATTPMKGSTLVGLLFNLIITSGISITTALFHYLICDRALNPSHIPESDKHMRIQTMSQYESL